MTGGIVVILGPTGSNLGAGMTGGECFVLDETSQILARGNSQLVESRRPEGAELARLRDLLARHAELTESARAKALLDDWDASSGTFWRIAPKGELARVEAVHEGSVADTA